MKLTSPAFPPNGVIPRKYTAFGENVNPPLEIIDIPEGTQSLALIMTDPDVPPEAGVIVWDHWVVFNIPADITSIPENWQVQGVLGKNTRGQLGYGGPKPPDKEHRYFFEVYALNIELTLPEGSSRADVVEALSGSILDQAELIGRYSPEPA